MIARHVFAAGTNATSVASEIVDGLRAPDLRCAFVFADWWIDPIAFARVLQRGLAPAPVIGGTTVGVIAPDAIPCSSAAVGAAAGLGLYGDWLRVGIGVGVDLPKAALTRSRDAVYAAAAELGTASDRLDRSRHFCVTISDGRCGHEEAFCIGSAAAAPQIRFVGGCVATDVQSTRKPYAWLNGDVMIDAGIVVMLESELPCHAVTSSHLVATDVTTVVTAASGRDIVELDGYPAATRLTKLVAHLGELDRSWSSQYSFARYVDGAPYVRSITHLEGEHVHLASAVDVGHVLRIMRPGDLIGQTQRDLAAAADKVGGTMSAMLAFSCIGRHWEAAARGLDRELATTYAAYPTVGFQSYGEQSGMLLVNHTLTGLAIGARR